MAGKVQQLMYECVDLVYYNTRCLIADVLREKIDFTESVLSELKLAVYLFHESVSDVHKGLSPDVHKQGVHKGLSPDVHKQGVHKQLSPDVHKQGVHKGLSPDVHK